MEYKDEIYTNVKINFDLKDRLKILIHGIANIRIKTKTENLPGEVFSETSIYVPKIFRKKSDGAGMEITPDPDQA
jgi:hypothetical protein